VGDHTKVVEHLKRLENEIYTTLSQTVKPNIGIAPLPKPFLIDLSKPRITDEHPQSLYKLKTISFNEPVPSGVRIGLARMGIPNIYYNSSYYDYKDGKREEVSEICLQLVKKAVRENAKAIIFPEYCIPRQLEAEITELAQKEKIILVGGVEGNVAQSNLRNQVLISIPGTNSPFYQDKHHPSVYESSHFFSNHEIHIFEHTSIGTFTVIVCSDYGERDLLGHLSQSNTPIDVLVVCSRNPNAGLFGHCAVADSWRLYCYVVIVNSCFDPKDPQKATAEGTALYSPTYDFACFHRAAKTIQLSDRQLASAHPELQICELTISDIVASRTSRKPRNPFLNPPLSCRSVASSK